MMTPDEAYSLTLRYVAEICGLGVRAEIKRSKAQDKPEMVARYSGSDRVAPDKWINVSFYPETVALYEAIFERKRRLTGMGISFDTGGGIGVRDWELDWSFTCQGVASPIMQNARIALEAAGEKVIREMEDNNNEDAAGVGF